jgi:phage terminase large subunit GpA-like protein
MSLKLLLETRRLGSSSQAEMYHKNKVRSRQAYYRKTIDRLARVAACPDLVKEWDALPDLDWFDKSHLAIKPPPILTITQWSDTYRKISSEFASEPGDWRTDKMPCMRAIMDACSPSDPAKKIVIVKPSQSGGTEAAVLNTVGFTMDVNPRSILIVFPTLELAEGFARERLDPMIETTPSLKDKVQNVDVKFGRASGTGSIRRKRYPGGFCNLVGANSTSGLSSRPVPIVIMDEVDRCINNAGREGNPTKLLSTRATTFFDRKEIYLSSPARQEDETGILQMYEDSNRAEVQVSCPGCQTYQTLSWEDFEIDSCSVPCANCKAYYRQWEWQSTPQRWVELNPGHPTKGFLIGWFVSPWVEWTELAAEWSEAKRIELLGDNSLMRVFVNTRLASSYKRLGKRIEIDLYSTRREVYPCHEANYDLPEGVKLVTAAVDVQDSMLVYEIIGWGIGKESWAIEAGDIQGDPGLEDVWIKLDSWVYNRILHWENGEVTRPRLIFVDSGGHKTTEVYKYCKARHPRVFAIKGKEGPDNAIITSSKRRQSVLGNWLVRVGTDTLREEFHSRMKIEKPGPGFCHFPKESNDMPIHGYTQDYFEQLKCEQRILTYDKQGFATYAWTKNRTEANDYLMCRCYARAALEYLKIPLDTMKRDVSKVASDQVKTVDINRQRVSTVEPNEDTSYGRQRQNISNVVRSRYGPSQQTGSFGAGGRTF